MVMVGKQRQQQQIGKNKGHIKPHVGFCRDRKLEQFNIYLMKYKMLWTIGLQRKDYKQIIKQTETHYIEMFMEWTVSI